MDPLVRLRDAHARGAIPRDVYDLTVRRFPITVAGINRVERASGLRYPVAYVEPSLVVSQQGPNPYEFGILFARTIPVPSPGGLEVVVQISAPLVAYGLKGTVHAILAHEFLHYLELARRLSRMEMISDGVTGNLFESVYADGSRLFEPRAVFGDRTLLDHITKRFPAGFRDRRLEEKALRLWSERGLPRTAVPLDRNTVKLPAESVSAARIDPGLAARLADLEERSLRVRRKRLY